MKMVRNKVNMATEHFGFMNLGRLGFSLDLIAKKKPTEKLGPVKTPDGNHPKCSAHYKKGYCKEVLLVLLILL